MGIIKIIHHKHPGIIKPTRMTPHGKCPAGTPATLALLGVVAHCQVSVPCMMNWSCQWFDRQTWIPWMCGCPGGWRELGSKIGGYAPKKKRKENGFLAILRLCPPTRMVKLLSDLLERLSYISDLQRLGIKFGHELNDLVMMFEITSPQVLSMFGLMGSNLILPKW